MNMRGGAYVYSDALHVYELVVATRWSRGDRRGSPQSGPVAAAVVDRTLLRAGNADAVQVRAGLLRLCGECGQTASRELQSMSAVELRAHLLRLLAHGSLLLLRRARPRPAEVPKPEAPATAELAAMASEQETWVEIQVVDLQGRPYRGRVEVELPDRQVVAITTNDAGILHLRSSVAGECTLTLPDLDGEAWRLD